MQHTEISPGIWFNQISDRCATITSKLKNSAPGWRVAYFGFDKYNKAISFVSDVKKLRSELKVEARKSERLSTKYEVKVTVHSGSGVLSPTKAEVARLRSLVEGNIITLVPHKTDPQMLVACINGLEVVRVYLSLKNSVMAWQDDLLWMPYEEARKTLAHEYFTAMAVDKAA